MLKLMLENFLKSELFWTILLVAVGFLLSYGVKWIKGYVLRTPNKIDDAVFNFLVNDIFLKVEKDKLDKFLEIYPSLRKLNKLEKAIKIFQIVYKEQTGDEAGKSLIDQAKSIWSDLAVMYPSNEISK